MPKYTSERQHAAETMSIIDALRGGGRAASVCAQARRLMNACISVKTTPCQNGLKTKKAAVEKLERSLVCLPVMLLPSITARTKLVYITFYGYYART